MKIEEIGCVLFHDFGANGIAVISGNYLLPHT
jgi:hypothetical protein